MVRLVDLIGKRVCISIHGSERPTYGVTLHGVESGGIWIESKELAQILGPVKASSRERIEPKQKPVFFIPYSQLVFLISASTDLDEKSFSE